MALDTPDLAVELANLSPQETGLRLSSARLVIERLLRDGATSRAEISRATGLSKQTISEVMRTLEREGWVREDGQMQGAVGRTAVTYALRPDAAFVLGIDLGGTKLDVALADLGGTVVAERVEATDRAGGRAVVAQIGTIAAELIATAGIDRARLRGAVMGSPGIVEPSSGAITIAPNIPGLDSFDVRSALADTLGIDVAIENDVNLAAFGEHWRGSSQGERNFVFIAIGTGIGMGIFCDGQLVRGARGAAGEIAYLPLGGDPFDSRGHTLGTLETAIGSAAISDRYAGLGGGAGTSVRTIFENLPQDARAGLAIDETARTIATALLAVHAILDPARIVLGGSIGARIELKERIQFYLARCMPQPVPLVVSALGSRATLIGAIGRAIDGVHRALFGIGADSAALALPPVARSAAE